MPHVKGNKFKPAAAAPAAPQVGALDVAGPSPVGKQPVPDKASDGCAPAPRGSSDTQRPTTHGAQVPTAGKTAAPHATAPPGKRRRKGPKAAAPPAQQVVQSLPATVVPPAPKASASGAIVAAPNWAALKAVLATTKKKPRANRLPATDTAPGAGTNSGRGVTPSSRTAPVTAVLALDCEMVGVGPDGERSSLARCEGGLYFFRSTPLLGKCSKLLDGRRAACDPPLQRALRSHPQQSDGSASHHPRVCIVNAEGGILLDVHVQQKERVTDYRTQFSGGWRGVARHACGQEQVMHSESICCPERCAESLHGNTFPLARHPTQRSGPGLAPGGRAGLGQRPGDRQGPGRPRAAQRPGGEVGSGLWAKIAACRWGLQSLLV